MIPMIRSLTRYRLRCTGPNPSGRSETVVVHVSIRQQVRSYSERSIKSFLPKNIFTRKALEQILEGDFRGNIPLNPLFTMSKSEILQINSKKYRKLAHLPMGSLDEAQTFCINMVDILNEVLIKDQKLVASLLDNLPNEELKRIILASLKRTNYDNKIKLSMIEMLIDIKSSQFRDLFLYILETVMGKSPTEEEKKSLLFSYLENLVLLGKVNPVQITIPNGLYDQILLLTPPTRLANLYSLLVNLNVAPTDFRRIEALQRKLVQGREIDRYIARTGEFNAKWHDTVKPLKDETQKQRMFHFMSFEMLESCARSAILKKDIADANVYLDLLVSKFEAICNDLTDSVFVLDDVDQKISSYVQDISKVIMIYLMEFKGVDACVQILQYMKKNNLEIKFDLLRLMMQQMIKQQYYDEAIVLVNNIDLDTLNGSERSYLVTELFSLMGTKFEESPLVLFGYAASLFRNPSLKKSVIELLNELGILGVIIGSGSPTPVDHPNILTADVDSRLTGQRFLHQHLYWIYKVALRKELDVQLIDRLFSLYIDGIQSTKARCLNSNSIDDQILTLFLNKLLRFSEHKWIINSDRNSYELAKQMVMSFYNFDPQSQHLKPYPFALMTYCALIHHNDYSFATRLIQMAKSYNLPLTFNQIYPFIVYHYNRKEYENAKYWYDLLVHSGVAAKSSDMRNVYKMARDQQWDVSGFLYRRNIIHKNYAKREALDGVKNDKISFLGSINVETDGLNGTFTENLTALLQKK